MKLGLAVGLLALPVAAAIAADMPTRVPMVPVTTPGFSWTGCYFGAYVGGAFGGNITARDTDGYNAVGDTWSYRLNPSVIGGGTLGCNYQADRFVFGLEGEGGYISLRGSALDPVSPFIPLDTTSRTRIGDWYALATGRAGIAWDRALLYAKGGAAFVNTQVSIIDPNPAGGNTITASGEQVRATWTAGGGIEYALGGDWTVKAEYLYIGMNQTTSACGFATVSGGRFCWSHDEHGVHTAKIGLNYLFDGGPVVPRY